MHFIVFSFDDNLGFASQFLGNKCLNLLNPFWECLFQISPQCAGGIGGAIIIKEFCRGERYRITGQFVFAIFYSPKSLQFVRAAELHAQRVLRFRYFTLIRRRNTCI